MLLKPEDKRIRGLARQKVHKALKDGTLVKPEQCSVCAVKTWMVEAHHEDYLKPLDVIWLCRTCHEPYNRRDIQAYKQKLIDAGTPFKPARKSWRDAWSKARSKAKEEARSFKTLSAHSRKGK